MFMLPPMGLAAAGMGQKTIETPVRGHVTAGAERPAPCRERRRLAGLTVMRL
jgi:hypothetical protein